MLNPGGAKLAELIGNVEVIDDGLMEEIFGEIELFRGGEIHVGGGSTWPVPVMVPVGIPGKAVPVG